MTFGGMILFILIIILVSKILNSGSSSSSDKPDSSENANKDFEELTKDYFMFKASQDFVEGKNVFDTLDEFTGKGKK